jgi:cytochrome b involved in lipid metabolism
MQEYTLEQVAQHNKEGDLWVVVDAKVYDLSKFAAFHPGGDNILLGPNIGESKCKTYHWLSHFLNRIYYNSWKRRYRSILFTAPS